MTSAFIVANIAICSLEDYNILTDRHLAHFFNSPRVKHHLIKAGLITLNGEIVPEKVFRSELIRKARHEAALNAHIQALTDEVIAIERNRQIKARKSIEDILNSQRIRKIRAERRQKREVEVLKIILFDADGFVDLETEEERISRNADLLLSPLNGTVKYSISSKGNDEGRNGHIAKMTFAQSSKGIT
ncbi:hypothetical protein TcWFU_001946 [Taenia crassiceps]|uniref:Uncharacterized protein n=1 Tax=Taenia crassiceps TaxID=6207 RepID=A0ABR4Q7M2_9CEST